MHEGAAEAAKGDGGALREGVRRSDESRTKSARTERLARIRVAKIKKSKLGSALQGAERHAKTLAGAADAEYRDCSCCGAEREAQSGACKYTLACQPRKLMPNPSLKRTPNGLARRSVWAGASPHFAQPGRRAKPSVAA